MPRIVTADEYRAMHEGRKEVERPNEDETFVIEVTMRRRWIPHFLGMLKQMQTLGSIGSSRHVSIYADGDGDFRPKFQWNVAGIEPAEPLRGATDSIGVAKDTHFDAG